MKDLIKRTRELFAEGMPLAKMVDGRLSIDLEMFSRGGLAVLDAIEAMGYDTLPHRPAIPKGKTARLLGRALLANLVSLDRRSERTPRIPATLRTESITTQSAATIE